MSEGMGLHCSLGYFAQIRSQLCFEYVMCSTCRVVPGPLCECRELGSFVVRAWARSGSDGSTPGREMHPSGCRQRPDP